MTVPRNWRLQQQRYRLVGEVCEGCGAAGGFEMVIVWKPRAHTRNRHMRFDSDLHFHQQ